MKNIRFILIALLVGVTAFSVFKYIMLLKEKQDLSSGLLQAQNQVSVLQEQNRKLFENIEKEKQAQEGLSQENTSLKDSLKAAEDKLLKLDADLTQAQKMIEQLNLETTGLRSENTDMKARLISIKELRKAIREVKVQMYQVKVEVLRKADAEALLNGNRGFLLKEGKSTHPTKVKIEVNPAP